MSHIVMTFDNGLLTSVVQDGTTPPPNPNPGPGPNPDPSPGPGPTPTPGATQFYLSSNYHIVQPPTLLHFVPGTEKWQTQGFGPANPAEGHIAVPAGYSVFQLSIIPMPTGPVGQLTCEVNGVPVFGNDVITYSMQVGEGPIVIKLQTTANSEVQMQTQFQ